jgi:hypothetical protein
MKCAITAAMILAMPAGLLMAQETTEPTFSLSLPVTLSGAAMYSERLQLANPDDSPATAGFRAMLYPTVNLGSNWFGYAAIQLREAPYFYYDAFNPEHEFNTDVIQALVGYRAHVGQTAIMIKAGRLSSAFGAFPLRYDDAENPLLDQPLSYITELPIRGDQIPCGVADLRAQNYGYVWNSCGGATGGGPGLVPVTLYGLSGVEADLSSGKFDGRLQLTSGSPVNPQGLTVAGQYLQWTAGGGYTIRQGFRVGMSGFRGPYLDRNLTSFLPLGTGIRSFPASGLGIDGQWARGRWSVSGEWQRFWFDSPNFTTAPSVNSGYAEAKSILTPRIYLAARAGWLGTGAVADKSGASANQFASTLRSYELGVGYWLGRNELLKGSYEWLEIAGSSGTRTNVLGAEFVFRFNSLAWSLR